jgi:hypothetical protein
MQKRTAAAKSKPRAKSASKASYTTDDVFALLKAVNEQTLARMEKQVKDVNEITLKRMEDLLLSIKDTGANTNYGLRQYFPKFDRVEQEVHAIKVKVQA